MVALVDLDDTLAAYSKALRSKMKALQAPGEPEFTDRVEPEPAYMEARRKLIQAQPGFWRDLEPIPLGFEIVEEIRAAKFELHVATKGPRRTTSAWTEKADWCLRHIPDAHPTVTSKKSLVYGRILADDWPNYFMAWLKVRPRGLVICPAQPWNADFALGGPKQHPNVLRYDGSDKLELRWAIEAAAGRAPGQALKRSLQPPFVDGPAR